MSDCHRNLKLFYIENLKPNNVRTDVSVSRIDGVKYDIKSEDFLTL